MNEHMNDYSLLSAINRPVLSIPSKPFAAQGPITQNPECEQIQIILMRHHEFCKRFRNLD
jgi:hypothetical protein